MKAKKDQKQLESSDLFGIRVDHFTLNDLAFLSNDAHIVTLNFEMLVEAIFDTELKQIINSAELVIADGAFISLLLLIFRRKLVKKIAGIDLAEYFIEKSQKIALLGAKKDCIEHLKKKFQDKIVFAHDGFFEENSAEEEKIVQKISESNSEVFLVALGTPKQEKFIYRNRKTIVNTRQIGVGGAFDIWSGELKRAPKWMRNFGLEWIFRIIQEPYRFKRLLYNVNRFFHLLLK